MTRFLAATVLAVLPCVSLAGTPVELALVGATVVDVGNFGETTADLADATVLIHDQLIAAVGPRSAIVIPPGAQVVDVHGQYIIPGLIDGFAAQRSQGQANAHLAMGVTTIVGMSDDLRDALEAFFDWQEQNRPEKRKETALMLTQLAGPAPALPSDVVAGEISTWMDVHGYFDLVAHSKHKTKPEEFVNNLFLVEDILLRRLQPRPVVDLDEIDALLAEADDAK